MFLSCVGLYGGSNAWKSMIAAVFFKKHKQMVKVECKLKWQKSKTNAMMLIGDEDGAMIMITRRDMDCKCYEVDWRWGCMNWKNSNGCISIYSLGPDDYELDQPTKSDHNHQDGHPALGTGRGKVMSQGANKLQRPFLANSIYSRDPLSKMSINSCENQINSCRH